MGSEMSGVISAVIFDLDGTLLDSAPDIHACTNAMLADYGFAPLSLDQVKGFVGNGVPTLVRRVLHASGAADRVNEAEALENLLSKYANSSRDLIIPYEGVSDMLAFLSRRSTPMGICTNRPKALTEELLRGLELSEYFSAIVGGDSLPLPKPDPGPLKLCLEMLGAPLKQTIFVGDSEADEATALALGMRFALFTGGYRKKSVQDFQADLVLTSMRDLQTAV